MNWFQRGWMFLWFLLHDAEWLAVYSSASRGFQIRQQDVRRLQREAEGRKSSREPPTEVPGMEDSPALSQGQEGDPGHREVESGTPGTWLI